MVDFHAVVKVLWDAALDGAILANDAIRVEAIEKLHAQSCGRDLLDLDIFHLQ